MIDVKLLRQDAEGVRTALARRLDPALDQALDQLAALDRQRRDALTAVEELKAKRNAATEEVARRKKAKEPAEELMAELRQSGEAVKVRDAEVREIEAQLDRLLLNIIRYAAMAAIAPPAALPADFAATLAAIGYA